MKAMLLLALNCCMYGREVASLNWSDLDLQKGVLNSERNGIELNIVRVLAGHATGISDHDVKRRPQIVAAACSAVYGACGPHLSS